MYFNIPFEFVDFLLVFLDISPGNLFTSDKTTILQGIMSLQERLQALHTDVVTLVQCQALQILHGVGGAVKTGK